MCSLGHREGDIIRVKKAIDQRQSKGKPDGSRAKQMRHDEEFAMQLQVEENGGVLRGQAPNLFAVGPNGALKATDGLCVLRPDTTHRSPASAISVDTPATKESAANCPPSRPSSAAAAAASGFDDDAWTNGSSTTKLIPSSSPALPPSTPFLPARTAVSPATTTGTGLANKIEGDIYRATHAAQRNSAPQPACQLLSAAPAVQRVFISHSLQLGKG
ncbi:hypothetical protein EIP86_005635 [Pleurotus ostreatoroseus]|nr:hypothetical protein EIP86_005635 [Pleurotus ostreatoroseus]